MLALPGLLNITTESVRGMAFGSGVHDVAAVYCLLQLNSVEFDELNTSVLANILQGGRKFGPIELHMLDRYVQIGPIRIQWQRYSSH